MEIGELLKQKTFKVKKPAKNEARLELIDKLATTLGRSKKSVHFTCLIWSNEMLNDALKACLHFSDIKARNFHFNEYRNLTKVNI